MLKYILSTFVNLYFIHLC